MRKPLLLILAAMQAGCGKPVPFESAESLAANPERLKEMRVRCKVERHLIGEAQCHEVAEATRLRFFSGGGPKHTPVPAASQPSASQPGQGGGR